MAGKTFPAFPTHAQPAILPIWLEAQVSANGVGRIIAVAARHFKYSISEDDYNDDNDNDKTDNDRRNNKTMITT